MSLKKLNKGLARAVVCTGVNVQPGEEVYVQSTVYAVDLTREVVRMCYERGAKRVVVKYRDEEISKLDFAYQTADTLSHKPSFMY